MMPRWVYPRPTQHQLRGPSNMLKLYDGCDVIMASDTYDVPRNTKGTIIREDQQDSDLWTYEVKFEDGSVLSGVRGHHLKVAA